MVSTLRVVLHYSSVVQSWLARLPLIGRLQDLCCSALYSLLRGFSGNFIAGGLDKCRRPVKELRLY